MRAGPVTTSTGQTLSIRACGNGPGATATGAEGVATISAGEATIASVFVRISDSPPEWVTLDQDGPFSSVTPWPSDWDEIEVSATVRASDGTSATSGCTLRQMGMSMQSPPTAVPPRTKELPDTGPSGPRTLGPIGLALVVWGSTLVWRSRRALPV